MALHATRRTDEDGALFYECGRCGARTTDERDVAEGICHACGWSEVEVLAWLRRIAERVDEEDEDCAA